MIFALFYPFMKVPAFAPAFFVEIFYKKVFDKNKKASIISGIKGKGVFGIIIPKGAFLFFAFRARLKINAKTRKKRSKTVKKSLKNTQKTH